MDVPEFRNGDVVCEHGTGFFGRAIQWFTRGWFEARTWASHAARMLDGNLIAEAEWHFEVHAFDPTRKVKVWRRREAFPDEVLDCFTVKAEHYKGKDYGWWKNAAHAADALLEKTPLRWVFGHVYLFRLVIGVSDYPICSWEVAWTFDECADYRFGVPPNEAAPDDIADYCESHPDEWECIYDNVTGA